MSRDTNWQRLTERERQVLAYVAAHHQSKSIARMLGTAPKTVDAQISSACRKLGVANSNEAVRLLLQDENAFLDIGGNPPPASSPMAVGVVGGSFLPVDFRGVDGDSHDAWNLARGRSADHDLRGSGGGVGAGGVERSASEHGALSGFGIAPTGSVSDGADGPVRDSSLGQLFGGHSGGKFEFLTQSAGWRRLAWAVAGSLVLAFALPLALKGALWLQKLVHSIQ